ncbi:hypothetical protein CcCBS67573_g08682 [Chytriomyces confervae]|uniref:Vacuolar protein 14 C-terminal Fig4-binding domain-containing protein n=1 Tax=Chytriomyces confervae TaxID=246404 RepID=A0A507EJA9_9FUNG|nr:hypothetical protein CcCBS67573_g08682 [Chytriomyces confervae]
MSEVLGVALSRQLQEKLYDKRKTAALEIERLVREALVVNNTTKVDRIIRAIVGDFAYSTLPNARNGGLIALAAVAIALGVEELALRLDVLVPPILSCFSDPDTRVRYYACESMYNVGKVARRHILRFFNEILDALSRLVADTDPSVKNGAELLDRLVKDIVCEYASYYSQQHLDQQQQLPSARNTRPPSEPAFPAAPGSLSLLPEMLPTTFNFPRFIPLLSERIKTLNPFTRMYLIQWITTLDSIPYLELVAYLPEFLDGLFNYLSDPNLDVRTAALNLLGEFLKEIHDVVQVQKEQGVLNVIGKRSISATPSFSGIVDLNTRNRANSSSSSNSSISSASKHSGDEDESSAQRKAASVISAPTAGVLNPLPHPYQLSSQEHDDDAMRRPASTLSLTSSFFVDTSKPSKSNATAVLTQSTSTSSIMSNKQSPNTKTLTQHPIKSSTSTAAPLFQPSSYQNGANVVLDIGKIVFILTPHVSSTDEETQATALRWIHQLLALVQRVMIPFTPELVAAILPCLAHRVTPIRNIAAEANAALFKLVAEFGVVLGHGAGVLYLGSEGGGAAGGGSPGVDVGGGFEVKSAVDALTKQFQDESEETRVASMEWLAMLHKKAPKKVIDSDDVTFQALLRLLSDTSEEVVKKDLQLLAQISMTSDDDYFTRFLLNLLDLFSSNKRLLESRGSLIIRHLCLSLNPERMFRVFAEILEREEDLEFASLMIQTLNIILVTAPELSDLRRRLKNLDSRDGLLLFAVLYRSWCHNPVSTFCLCLLSQAYEHASTLLQTFADLEITVQFLIQVDKLVQLIESPVFTYLRLQLLEPERYPFLYKALYGILMLLPQSSAFATLRNRLNSVGNMVMLYGLAPGSVGAAVGSGVGASAPLPGSAKKLKPQSEPLGLKWSELLVHFRNVQNRHERSRRTGARSNSATSSKRRANTLSTNVTSSGQSNRLSRSISMGASMSVNESAAGSNVSTAMIETETDLTPNASGRPLTPQMNDASMGKQSNDAAFYQMSLQSGAGASGLDPSGVSRRRGSGGAASDPPALSGTAGSNTVKTKKPVWSLGGSKR